MIHDREIIAFLACAYDENVKEEISKKYEFRLTELRGAKKYITSESFLSKEVTLENFDRCVEYVLKRLNNEDFKEEMHERDICYLLFYPKYDESGNLLDKNPALKKLNSKIKRKELVGGILKIYILPIKRWKEEISFYKEEIIDFFIKSGREVKDIEIIYCESEGKPIDEVAETLIDLGFSMEVSKEKK